MAHFQLPEGIGELVKSWVMKKMAKQFQSQKKKKLYNDYVKKQRTLVFSGHLTKLRDHQDEIVRYKTLEEGEKKPRQCAIEEISSQTGSRWLQDCHSEVENMEGVLLAKAITPATMDWPKCSSNQFYAHGGESDLETGACICGKESQQQPKELSKL